MSDGVKFFFIRDSACLFTKLSANSSMFSRESSFSIASINLSLTNLSSFKVLYCVKAATAASVCVEGGRLIGTHVWFHNDKQLLLADHLK